MAWLIVMAVIALPVVEIALFVKSAQWIGILPTIVLAIAAGMVGLAMVKRQGLETTLRARAQLDRGEMPVAEVFDGICLAVAGGLLFLPGFFSDFVAIALLLPPVRHALRAWLSGHVTTVARHPGTGSGTGPGNGPGAPPGQPPVIEAEYTVVRDDTRPQG